MRDQSEEPSESGTSGVNVFLTKDAGGIVVGNTHASGMFQAIMIPRISRHRGESAVKCRKCSFFSSVMFRNPRTETPRTTVEFSINYLQGQMDIVADTKGSNRISAATLKSR